MKIINHFWHDLKLLPSAWLLLVQLLILILSIFTIESRTYQILSWAMGVLALLIIAKVIRNTPTFTMMGLIFVGGAFIFSSLMLFGINNNYLQVIAHAFEASAYFCAA